MKGRVQFDALFEDVSFPARKCTTVSEASRSLAGIHHTNPRRVRALCKACPMREHGPRGARRSRGRGRCARGGRRSKAARSSLCSAHRDRVRPHCSPRWRAHRRSAKREREGKKGRPAGRSETNSTIFDPAQPTQCHLSTGRDPGDAPVGPGSLLKSHRRCGTIQSQPRTGSQRCGCCAAQMWVGTHGVIGRAHQSHSHSFLLRLGQHRYLDSFRKPVKTSACTSILKDRQLQVRRSLPPLGLCDRLRGDAHGLPNCSLFRTRFQPPWADAHRKHTRNASSTWRTSRSTPPTRRASAGSAANGGTPRSLDHSPREPALSRSVRPTQVRGLPARCQ